MTLHVFTTTGPKQYFPPLAPVGAPAASYSGIEDSQPRTPNGSSNSQEKGGYMVDSGSVRPLNPAEVQAAASMSSAQGTDSKGSAGETPAAQLNINQACACNCRQAKPAICTCGTEISEYSAALPVQYLTPAGDVAMLLGHAQCMGRKSEDCRGPVNLSFAQ